MSRHRRRYEYKGVYLVGNRTARGLPFVSCLYINILLLGVIVRAQFLYPRVVVCCWLFMANHYHGIVVLLGSPVEFRDFMKFVDGEIAKIINRLRAVSNQNVWASRYDAERLLTADSVIDKMAYIYLNPVRAHLVETIDKYPGVSTWYEFMGKGGRYFRWIGSSKVSKMPFGRLASFVVRKLVASLAKVSGPELPLVVRPFFWKECFKESSDWSEEEIKARVRSLIRKGEENLSEERKDKGLNVLGERELRSQNFFKRFRSKDYRKRSVCISSCLLTREQYLREYREFCELCAQAWQRWKLGDFRALFPPGAFRPTCWPTASIVTL